jgi:hypothetical protein
MRIATLPSLLLGIPFGYTEPIKGSTHMRLAFFLTAFLLPTMPLQAQTPMTAREYYEELKTANTFVHVKDVYACFRDDDQPSFAVMARGSDVIDEMKRAGVTPTKAVMAGKNELVVETFYKGVSNKTEIFDPVGTDGTDYDVQFDKPFHGRILYSINWATGRYRMMVYALDHRKALPAYEVSGRCEVIHAVK